MWRIIGKTDAGKLYHILDVMDGSGQRSLCGCYIPEDRRLDEADAFELNKQKLMCGKCMYSKYFKQARD